MFKYENGVLKVQKFEDAPIDMDAMIDQKNSYKKYMEETLQRDVSYLCFVITRNCFKGTKDITGKVRVGSLQPEEYFIEKKFEHSRYYPVFVDFYENGNLLVSRVPLFELPYMDNYCVLSINNKKKVLMSRMVRCEDISYDKNKNEVIVNMPGSFFKLKLKRGCLVFDIRGETITLDSMIYAFEQAYGFDVEPDNLFVNHRVKLALFGQSQITNASRDKELICNKLLANLIPGFNKNSYEVSDETGELGPLRNALNKRLSLYVAIGETLSRPVGCNINIPSGLTINQNLANTLTSGGVESVSIKVGDSIVTTTVEDAIGFELAESIVPNYIPAGTEITREVVKKIIKMGVNTIYVKAMPTIAGHKLVDSVTITKVPKGATITEKLRKILPELNDVALVRTGKDYVLEKSYTFSKKKALTKDDIQLLYDCGLTSLFCKIPGVTKKNAGIVYPFEQEIIGNYTARASDLIDNPIDLPDGIVGTDWIYYYNLTDIRDLKAPNCSTKFTIHDMLAIISLAGRLVDGDRYKEADDVDLDFFKKIDLFNEIVSEAFRTAAVQFVSNFRWKSQIKKLINSPAKANKALTFLSFGDDIRRVLWGEKLLRDSKDQTPINLVIQANKIITPVKKDAVSEGQRMLAMGFYGKICPFDVPQGKNIGVVNTKTTCSRIKDGIMYAPYLKLIDRQGTKYLSNTKDDVVYLNAEQERNYIIGDRESLKVDDTGRIKEDMVLARIPTMEDTSEKVKIGLVDTNQLDYVNAVGEEIVSAGPQVMPFCNSDDAVRVNFGDSLFQNSIYVQDGEIPYVITDMYSRIFSYGNDFVVKAEDDGYVVDVRLKKLVIKYDSRDTDTVIELTESKNFNTCEMCISYKYLVGERFHKGDILADTPVSNNGEFSPGSNVLTGYMCWGGRNYEDALIKTQHSSYGFTSVKTAKVVKDIPNNFTEIPMDVSGGRYVSKGGYICTLSSQNSKGNDDSSTEEWYTKDESGILYDVVFTNGSMGSQCKRSLIAKLLTVNKLDVGDKLSGRHGNKGVDAYLERDSKMPMFYNGKTLELIHNPLGVASRMNVGQNYEAMLGFVAYLLGLPICSNSYNGASPDDIHTLLKYVYAVCNAPIKDKALNSFYKTNSRVLVEILNVVKSIYKDVRSCIDSYSNLDILEGYSGDRDDLYSIREYVKSLISEHKGVNIRNHDKVANLLASLETTISNIDSSYDNLAMGIDSLLEKIGRSDEIDHKSLLRHIAEINDSDVSETYKHFQILPIIAKFLKGVSISSLRDIFVDFAELPNELFDVTEDRFWTMKRWEDCFFSDGTALLYNPDTGLPYKGHIQIGVPYFLKIVQEVDEKTGARGGAPTEKYMCLTKQPPQGGSRGGGQRTGEMELAALSAYGASDLIWEIYNTCSDNVGERIKDLYRIIGKDPSVVNEVQCHPRTVDMLRYILEALNVQLDVTNYPDIDTKTVSKYNRFEGKKFVWGLTNKTEQLKEKNGSQSVDKFKKDLDSGKLDQFK